MRLLLDTHVFIWWNEGNLRLPEAQRNAIATPGNEVFVSAVVPWEIGIKRASGKLNFVGSVSNAIVVHRFVALPISVEHAERAGKLPMHHRDPFDRMLLAQALVEGLTLLTVDVAFSMYQVPHP